MEAWVEHAPSDLLLGNLYTEAGLSALAEEAYNEAASLSSRRGAP